MTRSAVRRALVAITIGVAACSGGDGAQNPFATGPPTTSGSTSAPTSASTAGATTSAAPGTIATTSTVTTAAVTTTSFQPRGTFRVVVIVDMTSEEVTIEQAQALIADASGMHQRLSGFSIEMIDFVQAHPGPIPNGDPDSRDLDQLVYDYEAANFPDTPDGFMIFSFGHDDAAATLGGYTYTLPARSDHDYRFVPVRSPDPVYHVGIVHFGHRYASCGYGPDPMDRRGDPIRDTSANGECRNQDGVQCVEHNGYSMCITATGDLYASTMTYFAASTIVHETMHNFGDGNVAEDHYGTQACTDAMAAIGSTREYVPGSTEMFQGYSGICPFLYDRFIDSYVGG